MLAALEAVDLVVVFEEDTPLELIRRVRPAVLVKGADYRIEEVVGRDEVETAGGGRHSGRSRAPDIRPRSLVRRSAESAQSPARSIQAGRAK